MSQVGPGGFENVAGRVGSGQEVFEMSRVGSRRANKFSILAGRVGSRGFQISRIGSGRVMRCLKCHGSGRVMTREIRVTRGSGHNDPRVVFGRPAGRTRGSGPRIRIFANLQLPAGGPLA